ncbi:hypothetical protein F750_3353 [Streptomyces sp. PAMC 26508]|nr:hypothetical protein F750_3353 [Streptomyces sp. PAMC 26508]
MGTAGAFLSVGRASAVIAGAAASGSGRGAASAIGPPG